MRCRGIWSLRPAWSKETPITKPSKVKVNSSGLDCRSKAVSFCWTLIFQTSAKHMRILDLSGYLADNLFWLGYRTSEGFLLEGVSKTTQRRSSSGDFISPCYWWWWCGELGVEWGGGRKVDFFSTDLGEYFPLQLKPPAVICWISLYRCDVSHTRCFTQQRVKCLKMWEQANKVMI